MRCWRRRRRRLWRRGRGRRRQHTWQEVGKATETASTHATRRAAQDLNGETLGIEHAWLGCGSACRGRNCGACHRCRLGRGRGSWRCRWRRHAGWRRGQRHAQWRRGRCRRRQHAWQVVTEATEAAATYGTRRAAQALRNGETLWIEHAWLGCGSACRGRSRGACHRCVRWQRRGCRWRRDGARPAVSAVRPKRAHGIFGARSTVIAFTIASEGARVGAPCRRRR